MADDLSPEAFARELIQGIRKAPGQTVKVVRTGSQNVKNQARRNVRQTAPIHNAQAYRDISYDVDAQGVIVTGEIGYETGPGKAGNLGNLLEYGGGGDHSPPHRDLARALDGELPWFEKAIEDMGEAIIDGAVEAALARYAETPGVE